MYVKNFKILKIFIIFSKMIMCQLNFFKIVSYDTRYMIRKIKFLIHDSTTMISNIPIIIAKALIQFV